MLATESEQVLERLAKYKYENTKRVDSMSSDRIGHVNEIWELV